jgi:PAS domain S-box-containing protein
VNQVFSVGAPQAPRPPAATRFFAVTIFAPLLLLALALWFSSETRGLNTTRAMVRNSYEARIQATELLRQLAEAETAQRGFVITARPAFLKPFDGAHEEVEITLDALDARFAPGTAQRARTSSLRKLVAAKFDEMAGVIEVRRRQGSAAAAARVADGDGVRLMDAARTTVDAIVAAERRTLAARLAVVTPRNLLIERLVWSLVIVIGALMLLGAAFVWQSRRARYVLACEAYEATLRLHAIFASTIDAILIVDDDGRVVAGNGAATGMLGYRADELTDTPVLQLIDIGDPERSFVEVIGFAENELARSVWLDRAIRRKDGKTVPIDIALGIMALPDALFFVATLRDISERKAAERLKDEFIATVSHELRTPLTSVVGSLGLLRAGAVGELPDAARRLVDIAETNSQRLIGLINDILDIEKIGSGRMHFESRPLPLDRVVREAVEAARGLAESRSVGLELTVPAAPVIVDGDADRLMQVFGNLLSNAIRFSPAAGTVRLLLARDGDEAIVSVQDEGPGVPPEFETRMFERFSQAGDKTVSGGTGLGLAISREIMAALGGRIWFGKAPGSGACFSIAMPIATISPIERDRRQARLLVCEDQPDIAEVLRRLIESEGCTVDCVTTAQALEEAARTGRYDGIVLDLVLPDASGLDAVRRLRRRAETRTTPIVVVSAFAGITEADPSASALDVIDWIDKPVDQQRLIRAVRRAIDRSAVGRPTLLHIDDDVDMLEVTATALADQGRILRATSLASARALLADTVPDVIILDLGLPDGSGLSLLPELFMADGSAIPTIIYSAEEVVPAIKQQVDAVIVKSRRSLPSLAVTIRHLLKATREDEAP